MRRGAGTVRSSGRAVAVVLATIGLLTVAAVPAGAQQEFPIRVEPSSGLSLDQPTTITVGSTDPSDWPSSTALTVLQCAAISVSGCDTDTSVSVTTNESGVFSTPFTVVHEIDPPIGHRDCREAQCYVVVADASISNYGWDFLLFGEEFLPPPPPEEDLEPGTELPGAGTPEACTGDRWRIVYTSAKSGKDEDIWVVDPQGKRGKALTGDPAKDSFPDVSPDGEWIAFQGNRLYEGSGPFAGKKMAQIFKMRRDGTDVQQISGELPARDPVWSPDGSRIAFVRVPPDAGVSYDQLFVMNADGSDVRQLTSVQSKTAYVDSPAWSSDGRSIAFELSLLDRPSPHTEIFVANVDGSESMRQLTSSPGPQDSSYDPAWSPDGQLLAFHGRWGDNSDIYTIRADGADVRRLTWSAELERQPVWSPDGLSIAYETGSAAAADISVMGADGNGARTITGRETTDRFPDWSACLGSEAPEPEGLEFGDCEKSVRFGIGDAAVVDGEAGCFIKRLRDGVYQTTDKFKLNGIELQPTAGSIVKINPDVRRIWSEGSVFLVLQGIDVPVGLSIDWTMPATGTLGASVTVSGFKIFGIPLQGTLPVTFTDAASRLDFPLDLPEPLPATVWTVTADNKNGVQLAAAVIKVPSLKLPGLFDLEGVEFSYKAPSTFTGKGTLKLVDGSNWSAAVTISNGNLDYLGGRAENVKLGGVVTIKAASLEYVAQPLKLTGAVNVALGPDFGGLPGVVTIEGTAELTGQPMAFVLTARATILNVPVVAGKLSFDGKVARFNAAFNWKPIDLDWVAAEFNADVSIEYQALDNWGFEGGADVHARLGPDGCLIGNPFGGCAIPKSLRLDGSGRAVLSSKGWAVCGSVGWLSGGVNGDYSIPPHVSVFDRGCDNTEYQKYKVKVATAAIQASTLGRSAPAVARGTPVDVAGDAPFEIFRVKGSEGVPNVVLTGPGGMRIEGSPEPNVALVDDDVIVVNIEELRTSYVFVARARTGEVGGRDGPRFSTGGWCRGCARSP